MQIYLFIYNYCHCIYSSTVIISLVRLSQRAIQTCLVRTAPPVVSACSEQVVTKVLVTVRVTYVHLGGLEATVASVRFASDILWQLDG